MIILKINWFNANKANASLNNLRANNRSAFKGLSVIVKNQIPDGENEWLLHSVLNSSWIYCSQVLSSFRCFHLFSSVMSSVNMEGKVISALTLLLNLCEVHAVFHGCITNTGGLVIMNDHQTKLGQISSASLPNSHWVEKITQPYRQHVYDLCLSHKGLALRVSRRVIVVSQFVRVIQMDYSQTNSDLLHA